MKFTLKPKCCKTCGEEFQPSSGAQVYCPEHGLKDKRVVVARRAAPPPRVPAAAREAIRARIEEEAKAGIFTLLLEKLAEVEARVELIEWERGEGQKTLAGGEGRWTDPNS